jgi:gluconolactonase
MKHSSACVFTLTLCTLLDPGAPVQAGDFLEEAHPTVGSVIRLDPAIDALIPAGAVIQQVATGFGWSEGPVWVWRKRSLYFSDVPKNVVWGWGDFPGLDMILQPSGNTHPKPGQGSNGLTLDTEGRLVLAQHGDRRVSRLEADGSFTILAEYYKWHRFNSPNDLVYHSNGDLYFTDPPYGLEGGNSSPAKELPFNGVFRVSKSGTVTLLDDQLTYPNGIAFPPDEKTLYVGVSDSQNPVLMAYQVKADGTLDLKTRRVFFDGKPLKAAGAEGSFDGLKVDVHGNVWATGPGGVLVLSPDGRHLGTVSTGGLIANCGWGQDGSVLYLTAHESLCRIQTSTLGVGPGFRQK